MIGYHLVDNYFSTSNLFMGCDLSRMCMCLCCLDLRGAVIQSIGTKQHHDKCFKDNENYMVKGCFAMTELGHGSNVCRVSNHFVVLNVCFTRNDLMHPIFTVFCLYLILCFD